MKPFNYEQLTIPSSKLIKLIKERIYIEQDFTNICPRIVVIPWSYIQGFTVKH